jgi:hypothetical protein
VFVEFVLLRSMWPHVYVICAYLVSLYVGDLLVNTVGDLLVNTVGDLLVNKCGKMHVATLKNHFRVVPRIKKIFATRPFMAPWIAQSKFNFDMDMSYARVVCTASLTSYPVKCKM